MFGLVLRAFGLCGTLFDSYRTIGLRSGPIRGKVAQRGRRQHRAATALKGVTAHDALLPYPYLDVLFNWRCVAWRRTGYAELRFPDRRHHKQRVYCRRGFFRSCQVYRESAGNKISTIRLATARFAFCRLRYPCSGTCTFCRSTGSGHRRIFDISSAPRGCEEAACPM